MHIIVANNPREMIYTTCNIKRPGNFNLCKHRFKVPPWHIITHMALIHTANVVGVCTKKQ